MWDIRSTGTGSVVILHNSQCSGFLRVCDNALISEALWFDFERLFWFVGLARISTMNNILFAQLILYCNVLLICGVIDCLWNWMIAKSSKWTYTCNIIGSRISTLYYWGMEIAPFCGFSSDYCSISLICLEFLQLT